MQKSFSERVQQAKEIVAAISVASARVMQQEGDALLIDPRPADAIRSSTGLISGAHNVTLDDISSGRLPQELASKNVHVITACQAGPMGAIAAFELHRLGFASVSYLDGGTQAWLDAGLPTDR